MAGYDVGFRTPVAVLKVARVGQLGSRRVFPQQPFTQVFVDQRECRLRIGRFRLP